MSQRLTQDQAELAASVLVAAVRLVKRLWDSPRPDDVDIVRDFLLNADEAIQKIEKD